MMRTVGDGKIVPILHSVALCAFMTKSACIDIARLPKAAGIRGTVQSVDEISPKDQHRGVEKY